MAIEKQRRTFRQHLRYAFSLRDCDDQRSIPGQNPRGGKFLSSDTLRTCGVDSALIGCWDGGRVARADVVADGRLALRD